MLWCCVLWVAALPGPVEAEAAGSWVGNAASVRLFTPGRDVESRSLQSSMRLAGTEINSVSWRFVVPPRSAVSLQAWLCHPRRCLRLDDLAGRSEAFAGLSAGSPLVFRFRLAGSAHPTAPLRVEQLQVIVNYRESQKPE